jgi:hypothetical protein
MGAVFEEIDEDLRRWIGEQALYFVATAPLAAEGHVNLSPKGPIGTLAVTGPRQVAYLDIVGSGAETAAHLRENGRIVVMLCSFGKRPRIVRIHGSGRVVWAEDAEFARLAAEFALPLPDVDGLQRAIVVVDADRISDSCGFGVPVMEHVRERDNAERWARGQVERGDIGLEDYKTRKNTASLDGLPAWPGPAADAG